MPLDCSGGLVAMAFETFDRCATHATMYPAGGRCPLCTDYNATAISLSKRELFAAMAMQGLLATDPQMQHTAPTLAGWAVEAADALIEVLK